jgi:hypothetical protein
VAPLEVHWALAVEVEIDKKQEISHKASMVILQDTGIIG